MTGVQTCALPIYVFVETGTDNNGITGFSIGQKPNEIAIDHFITTDRKSVV